ncbi:hypothetical protein V494_06845 [Pseudogymnoascus sp. VKM F-4513 (FW-928)]|nr:hypothetical protein V494_06845 [Pseudogymnoascus sp. VKM F-4513 (FW-928)]
MPKPSVEKAREFDGLAFRLKSVLSEKVRETKLCLLAESAITKDRAKGRAIIKAIFGKDFFTTCYNALQKQYEDLANDNSCLSCLLEVQEKQLTTQINNNQDTEIRAKELDARERDILVKQKRLDEERAVFYEGRDQEQKTLQDEFIKKSIDNSKLHDKEAL